MAIAKLLRYVFKYVVKHKKKNDKERIGSGFYDDILWPLQNYYVVRYGTVPSKTLKMIKKELDPDSMAQKEAFLQKNT